jgi:nitrous oxide reductase
LEVEEMTDNKEKKGVEDRRDFLKKAALSVAAAGTAAVASKSVSADAALDTSGSGYRVTDHVKAFYKSARF